MGCLPERSKNNQIIQGFNGKFLQDDTYDENNKNWYTEGMLIRGRNDEPSNIYIEKEKIGEGAYGKVIEVQHKISKVFRAMKIINKNAMSLGNEEEDALINEINIVKSLEHPNIMKVYEFFQKKDRLYIISELLSGGELLKKINDNNQLSEDVSAFLMKQIISAVDFCHQKGIIHRDLKPENILIESQEEAMKEFFTIKIIDFGTSGQLKKGELLNLNVGTPLYIAPEIINNKKYDGKCDLWSCGVIMYDVKWTASF